MTQKERKSTYWQTHSDLSIEKTWFQICTNKFQLNECKINVYNVYQLVAWNVNK